MPSISVITINYNNAQGLRETFESIFSQNHIGFEFIVIDGASNDDSKNIILANADKVNYWVSEEDKGLYDAMNKGIEKANGEYVMFLNSGDYLLHNNVLADAIKCMEHSKADVYYGNIQLEDPEHSKKSQIYPSQLTLDFWEHYTINHQAAFIKTSLFKEMGYYSNQYSLAADYAFFIKCFVAGKQFEHIHDEIVNYKSGGASSVHKEKYLQQMKEAWKTVLPQYMSELYNEHKNQELLMKHRLMRLATKLQKQYTKFKKLFT